MFTVFGQRFNKIDPFVLSRDIKDVGKKGTVIYDGEPEKISLGSWSSEKTANHYMENIKNHVGKRTWKLWIEKTS
jgi:hypothetical protein